MPTQRSTHQARRSATIKALSVSIFQGSSDLLKSHFAAEGAAEPRLIWSPSQDDYGSPILRSFADVCDAIGTPGGAINIKDFSLDAFDGLDRWLLILERKGDDFVYNHYGAEIRDNYGSDMTGKLTTDFPGHIGSFFSALYSAAAKRAERVLSEHEPPRKVFVRAWRRLIVPLVTDEDGFWGFVAANIPDNELRAGLEMIIDPVIVSDGDGFIQYMNSAALQNFRTPPDLPNRLKYVTGLSLYGFVPPEVLLARREVIERLELLENKSGLMERVSVSISAAEHRGQAYYVILIRLLDRS